MKYVKAFENFEVPWTELVENNINFKFIQTIRDLFTSESEEDYELEITAYSICKENYKKEFDFKPIYTDDGTEESDVIWASPYKEREMTEEIRKGNVWYRINFKTIPPVIITRNRNDVDVAKQKRKENEIFDNVIERLSSIYNFKITNHPSIDNLNDIFGENGFKTYNRDGLFLKII